MAYSHIAHDCFVGNNCIFSNNTTLAGHVTVGDYVIISGLTAIHQFCSIGNHAFVTGGSLLEKMCHHLLKQPENRFHTLELTQLDLEEEVLIQRKSEKFKIYTDYYIKKIIIIHKPVKLLKLKWRLLMKEMRY